MDNGCIWTNRRNGVKAQALKKLSNNTTIKVILSVLKTGLSSYMLDEIVKTTATQVIKRVVNEYRFVC